jgi:molybdopterin molybdotransferase
LLPKGSDSVVKVENTIKTGEDVIQIERSVSPWENVNIKGSDFEKDSLLYTKGHVIRPQDIGVLTALGFLEVCVVKRPVVAVISTGNEINSQAKSLMPGQIRDINTPTLCACVELDGAVSLPSSPVQDEFEKLREAVEAALEVADMVLISGGSAKGEKDITHSVIESMQDAKVLIRKNTSGPGKTTMVAKIGCKAIFGLPGHPLSAFLIYRTIISGFIRERLGKKVQEIKIEAFFTQNYTSKQGREEIILVRLEDSLNGKVAIPITFKPYSLSAMVKAEGMIYIPADKEMIAWNEKVDVLLY